jgi:hypothetical protein
MSLTRLSRAQVQQLPSQHKKVCQASAAGAAGGSANDQPSSSGNELSQTEVRIAAVLRTLTNFFPLWVVLAAVLGYNYPPLFSWFTDTHITYSLMFCMLGMGLTLTFDEILGVFTKMPQLLLLGMVSCRPPVSQLGQLPQLLVRWSSTTVVGWVVNHQNPSCIFVQHNSRDAGKC